MHGPYVHRPGGMRVRNRNLLATGNSIPGTPEHLMEVPSHRTSLQFQNNPPPQDMQIQKGTCWG